LERSGDPYTKNGKDGGVRKWNMKNQNHNEINTLKLLKLKCSDPLVVQTKGKAELSCSDELRHHQNAVEKVDDLGSNYVQQGMQ
jgi:hypothetical protein